MPRGNEGSLPASRKFAANRQSPLPVYDRVLIVPGDRPLKDEVSETF